MSDTMRKILDDAKEQLISSPDEVGCIISNITRQLFLCKQELDRKQWQVFMEDCRQHNIISLLHQDPMTARAYAQPRGYQGDAELIDIIYSMNYKQYTNINATTLGDKIFRHTILCKAPSAVRLRRDFLTEQLNDICSKQSNAQILSIACGHLREALVSSAILNRKFSRFIGLDQDNTSLNTVNMTLGNLGVETIQMSIIDLLLHESIEEKFNYIYAAGLYDYLSIRQCKRLTKRLFDMLLPGGSKFPAGE